MVFRPARGGAGGGGMEGDLESGRVKDPLGHYEALKAKTGPSPMSDLGAIGRIIGLVALLAGSVGLLVYGLLF